MARLTKTIEISEGRDAGKKFLITEMSAESAEWWAFRVLQALSVNAAELNFQAPLHELAKQGLTALAKVPPEQAKPLFDELMTCVKVVIPDGSARDLTKNDIEEVKTRLKLRMEVLTMHISFFMNGDQ